MNHFEFKPIDEKTKQKEIESRQLKLCLCPLCMNGIEQNEGSNQLISWIYIMRVILYSLTKLHPAIEYFTLKKDVYGFVYSHWHIFGRLKQFVDKPNKWKKAFLDALSHSPYFESGFNLYRTTGYWKLVLKRNPWVTDQWYPVNVCYSKEEIAYTSSTSRLLIVMDDTTVRKPIEPQTSFYEIQMKLRDSYIKLYDYYQKVLKYYDGELQRNISYDSKINLLKKINSLKVIERGLYLLLSKSEENDRVYRQRQVSQKPSSGCLFFNVVE